MITDTGGYFKKIRMIQRADLDDQSLRVPENEIRSNIQTAVDLEAVLPIWLVEIRGISRPPETSQFPNAEPEYLTKNILAGLNGQNIPVYFLIKGEKRSTRIFLGSPSVESGQESSIRALVESYYPGARLWPEGDPSAGHSPADNQAFTGQWQLARKELAKLRGFINYCPYVGIVTGIPTPNPPGNISYRNQIDQLIRGLYGQEWAYLVIADPLSDQTIVSFQLALLKEQLRLEQEEGLKEWRESSGSSLANYYYQLLQLQQQLYEICLNEGGWQVQSYFCATDKETYQRGKAIIKSVFSGNYSRVDRIRVLDCPGTGKKAASFSPIIWQRENIGPSDLAAIHQTIPKYHTVVSSSQLSAAVHLPSIETPGFFVRDTASFDVTSHVLEQTDTIKVGEILDLDRPTNNQYLIRTKDLNKHCLIVGITGSGKTNTIFHLLNQLESTPFLVLEPAKREYRNLVKWIGTNLQIFTVGEEGRLAAPFRINPFEIQPGVSVQSHIDLLKSVFNASFGMWAPLPQVLERAIIEVYQDKGWDTVNDTNQRSGPDTLESKAWHPLAHPTLSDLYHKIGDLVPRLGYDKEVSRNVRTALETRINSLRIGAKGLLLDTTTSIPIKSVLQKPTIMELEGIGDDDEKAFLMGLILIALYEHYRSQGPLAGEGLRHLTIIEEAHRLLSNVATQANAEIGNPRAKAVETFINMLSEVRAYGEGFMIAEQIPTKLAPDVIKNTAFKIMQRTVSKDDRLAMGSAMNLKDEHIRRVVSLGMGQAVVHGGGSYGDDNAILVQVPYAKGDPSQKLTPEDIRANWKIFVEKNALEEIFKTYPACDSLCPPDNPNCASAKVLAEDTRIIEATSRMINTIVSIDLSADGQLLAAALLSAIQNFNRSIHSVLKGTQVDIDKLRCVVSHSLHTYLTQIGTTYEWYYPGIRRLHTLFFSGIAPVLEKRSITGPEIEKFIAFISQYLQGCKLDFDPYYGCDQACPAFGDAGGRLCLYRHPISMYIENQSFDAEFTEAGLDLEKLSDLAKSVVNRILSLDQGSTPFIMAENCFLVQRIQNDTSLSVYAQRKLVDRVIAYHQPDHQVESEIKA